MNKIIKKILTIGLGAYFAAYAALGSYAYLEYKKNEGKNREDTPNHLIVKKYIAKINGKEKPFAIVGENHRYTRQEKKAAVDLIDKYKNVAIERAVKKALNNRTYWHTIAVLDVPSRAFYLMGSDRVHPDSDFISMFLAKKKFYLENENGRDDLNVFEKAVIFGETAEKLLTAPLLYFTGKNEKNIAMEEIERELERKHKSNSIFKRKWKKRNKVMTYRIKGMLEKDDIDSMVCFVGQSHLLPVSSALEKILNIERAE